MCPYAFHDYECHIIIIIIILCDTVRNDLCTYRVFDDMSRQRAQNRSNIVKRFPFILSHAVNTHDGIFSFIRARK